MSNKTVLVLGATGMLGHEVARYLHSVGHDVISAARDIDLLTKFDPNRQTRHLEFDALKCQQNFSYFSDFIRRVGAVDYVVNAIGLLIPFAINSADTFFVNSVLPHMLAKEYGSKLIHITSDCVFSGKQSFPYDEDSPQAYETIYGITKGLGEPHNCLTIRTSIIGRELDSSVGLLEWFLDMGSQQSKVNGYTDHIWNGITTTTFARICNKIIKSGIQVQGLYHVFGESLSKHDMLKAFKKRYGLKCEITPVSGNPIDRRLSTIYHFNSWCRIPSFQDMLKDMPVCETITE